MSLSVAYTYILRTPGCTFTSRRMIASPTSANARRCDDHPVHSLPDLGSLKRRVHTQISHSNMQGVEKLLELGGSIDFRDAAERTILHRACEDVSAL